MDYLGGPNLIIGCILKRSRPFLNTEKFGVTVIRKEENSLFLVLKTEEAMCQMMWEASVAGSSLWLTSSKAMGTSDLKPQGT